MSGSEPASERRALLVEEAALATWLRDGMCVALGGLATACHAMIGVRHMIRRGLRDLTVVGSAVGGLDVDLLIGAGCVRKVICPYVGAEALASIGPFYRAAAEREDGTGKRRLLYETIRLVRLEIGAQDRQHDLQELRLFA